MKIQIVCRSVSYYSPDEKQKIEEPFDLGHEDHKQIVLVPASEDYHYVKGQLIIEGIGNVEVICIPPPSEFKPAVGVVPYALVTNTHTPHCDVHEQGLKYYFTKG